MKNHYRFLWLLVSLTVGLMTTTQAATFTVTTTADGGTGSLRQAITDAQSSAGADVIQFAAGLTGIISLTSALPDIVDDLSFLGPGAANLTVRRSSGSFRIFNIPNDNIVSFDGLTIADGSVVGTGGGINNAGQLTITNCVILNNQATANGGGVHNTNQLIVTNTRFTGNSADAGGGIVNAGGSSTLTSCSLISNQAEIGGAIYVVNNHTATLTNCSLQSNSATYSGGGIYNNGGSSTLTSCSLTTNQATDKGGAIFSSDHTGTLTNCSLQSNSANFGGGIFNGADSSTLTSCSLTSNHAAFGGAIYNAGHTATLTNCSLQSNSATEGGGFYNDGGSSTLTSCSLTTNQAIDGGAIYNLDHTAILGNCSLQSNSATNLGGGIYNLGGNSTLTSCSLTSNQAANDGGAIYNFRHTATLTDCSLQGNSATDGGGIANVEGSSTLTSCSLTTNQATNYGGAILNVDHTATLTNCSLQSNSATISGGGIANFMGSSSLTNCSLQSNQATTGGAIYNEDHTATLTNCVLFGNNGANTFATVNSSTLTATYSLFEPSALVAGVDVSSPGNLTTLTTPFVSANSVALAACSPAINAGLNAANTTTIDLVGQPRFVEGRIDMGAIEFQGATTLTVGITANPSLTIIQGQSTTLTASGGSSYSWSSAESTTAIVVSVAGPYSVTGITGSCSGTATVNVVTTLPPSITAQPASASTVCAGASVVVPVGVSGSISGYQWLKSPAGAGQAPQAVSGQTGPTLSLGNVQTGDAATSVGGVYSLSVTGPGGNTTSSNFTLTVNPLPVVTLTIPFSTTAQGASGIALITLPANGLPTTFQASGGQSYERVIILDRINGYEIRQVDSNTTGIFTINRLGLFTLTVTGAGGCQRTVQWVVQGQ